MAKGKKQKPKKRVARRVDEDLEAQEPLATEDDREATQGAAEASGADDGADDGADASKKVGPEDGATEDDATEDDATEDDATEDDATEDDAFEPVAARDPQPRRAAPSRVGAAKSPAGKKAAQESSEMPITQTSESGGVYFLVVVFSLLGGAVLLGLLTG